MSKALQVLHVKELVHETRGQIFADSLGISERFEKRHFDVVKKIEKMIHDDEKMSAKVRLSFYVDEQNREQKKYDLDRDAFVFVVSSFTGKKVSEWKWEYIEAFNTMEQMLHQKQNNEWQIARQKGTLVRKDLSDTIHNFVEYASRQGSTKAKFYYSTITKETYKALKLLEARETVPSHFRDTLTNFDLSSLTMAEYVAQGALMEGMIKQMFYKDIYHYAKEKVLIFASSIAVAKITSDFTTKQIKR